MSSVASDARLRRRAIALLALPTPSRSKSVIRWQLCTTLRKLVEILALSLFKARFVIYDLLTCLLKLLDNRKLNYTD